MPIGGFGRHRKQLLLSFGELINPARNKGWELTTGKKKSNCQCPALELSGAEWLAQLVGEMIFRQEFPQAQGLDITDPVDARGIGRSIRGRAQALDFVQPLGLGELLPEYHFTNQLGQPFSTAQFKGRALAITFLFTRCPFPTFCPRMVNQFAEAQQKLLAMSPEPANWHLLTISFDPEFDTPPVLKTYAQSHHYEPSRWTFATGELSDIEAFGEQFGLTFWPDG